MATQDSASVLPLYILAGGHSSRFGSDKALALFHGRPLITHVAEQFRPWTNNVTVVADRSDKYHHLGFRTIADHQPHLGPLGGLLTAVNDCQSSWLLLAACDALILDNTALDRLMAEPRSDCHVIAFKGELWEPLPALFCKLLSSTATHSIEQGLTSLWRFIDQSPHRAVLFSPNSIAQINTLADLRAHESSTSK